MRQPWLKEKSDLAKVTQLLLAAPSGRFLLHLGQGLSSLLGLLQALLPIHSLLPGLSCLALAPSPDLYPLFSLRPCF